MSKCMLYDMHCSFRVLVGSLERGKIEHEKTSAAWEQHLANVQHEEDEATIGYVDLKSDTPIVDAAQQILASSDRLNARIAALRVRMVPGVTFFDLQGTLASLMRDMQGTETHNHRFRCSLLELEDQIEAQKPGIAHLEKLMTDALTNPGATLTRTLKSIDTPSFHFASDASDFMVQQHQRLDEWLERNCGTPDDGSLPSTIARAEKELMKAIREVARKEGLVWFLLETLCELGAKLPRQRLITEFFKP